MNTWEVGALAEAIALRHERTRIPSDLLERVRLVSDQVGLGYDIESVTPSGERSIFKAIEVKAWHKDGSFLISKNEVEMLRHLKKAGWIYLVDVTKRRVVEEINNPFASTRLKLEPVLFRCLF